jgi:hypothetical protein
LSEDLKEDEDHENIDLQEIDEGNAIPTTGALSTMQVSQTVKASHENKNSQFSKQ